jgi:hypothetical protein
VSQVSQIYFENGQPYKEIREGINSNFEELYSNAKGITYIPNVFDKVLFNETIDKDLFMLMYEAVNYDRVLVMHERDADGIVGRVKYQLIDAIVGINDESRPYVVLTKFDGSELIDITFNIDADSNVTYTKHVRSISAVKFIEAFTGSKPPESVYECMLGDIIVTSDKQAYMLVDYKYIGTITEGWIKLTQ